MFCQPPPFDPNGLRDEEFTFVVCKGESDFLCCQLLPCDVIVMTVERAQSEHARSCAGLRFQKQPPLLVVMADDRTAVPEHLHSDSVIPEGATASELVGTLHNLPRRGPEGD